MIFETSVHSVQNLHLSYVLVSTISKRTETSIHLSLVTYEYHRVCPKRFLSLWYVWHKPCTFLALILTLYPNGQKRDSTCALSPRSLSGAVKMISEPCLEQTVHLSCTNTNTIQTDRNKIALEPRHLGVPSCACEMISKPCSAQTVHLFCTNTNTISKRTETSFHLTPIT